MIHIHKHSSPLGLLCLCIYRYITPHIDKTETKANQTQHIVAFWQLHTKTPGKECRKGKI